MLDIIDSTQKQKTLPLFRLGFRLFFLLGSTFALLSMGAWTFTLTGKLTLSPLNDILWWHSHEMLFGFVTAIIAGFLLTAVSNWTGIPGVRGLKLAIIFSVWLAARLLIILNFAINPTVIIFVDLIFLPLVAFFLGYSLFSIRQYRNMIFILLLLLMTLSNLLTYLPQLGFSSDLSQQGLHSMALLVVLLIALLGGRVIPMFTANGTGTVKVLPLKWLEISSLTSLFLLYLVMLLGFEKPTVAFATLAFIASGLHFYRCLRWRPWITLHTPLLWSLHVSMLFIPIGLALIGLHYALEIISLSTAIHSLTVGTISGMILSMMSRVSLGHTGRALKANRLVQLAFISIVFSAITRSLLIAVLPDNTSLLWILSGVLWCIAFSSFLWVYSPILTTSRIDGRPG
jgi:uncharacterized protein involved in response to NO